MMLKAYSFLKHKYLHLLIYYLSGYFRRGVNFAFFSQTIRVGSNFAKIEKKQNKFFYVSSFILSHSNKGIKHSEDFDKKKSNVNWVVL